ncbi:coiled-coil domain-containing protein 148-like [Rhopilema esculentum]|uniref:coiled-coil domain-containing protein 148-like n=1 Tax=Rhopilema esculentum TaxID=499914 RepID=UPI0031CFB61A
MSGRDFKSFLSCHQYQMGRAADPKMVSRCIAGSKVGTYKAVDYDKMNALLSIKKSSGKSSLKKLEKITKAKENKRETALLQQHKKVWQKEHVHLKHMLERIENETEICISKFSNSEWTFLNDLYFEITSLIEALKDNRADFQESTVQPIFDLREDLQYWVEENREKLILGIASDDHARISDVATSVKKQQQEIIEKLEKDKDQLENELEVVMSELGIEQVDFRLPHVFSGIPNEAIEYDCFDENLKANCLSEFNNLDYKHELHFKYLEEKYADVIRRAPSGKWSANEHLAFQHILEQYADEKHDRRMLYIDRMIRNLPNKTRQEIVEHEDWWFAFKSFQNQFRDQLHAWQRDRTDLLLKIKAVFAEANAANEAEMERFADRQKQKKICEDWHQKVLDFQLKKQEMMRLEAAIKLKNEEQEIEARRLAEEKERNRRQKIKSKLETYQSEKQDRLKQEKEREQERLMELQAELEEQRIRDKERVEFREVLLREKDEKRKQAKEREEEQEKEKEERLEKLRKQVRVEATCDAARVLEPTEAYQARQAAKFDEERELQEPLFVINTFNTNQVLSDNRLKMENALRKAGLHNSDYARHVMSNVAPPTVPRKDAVSTLFKQS